MLVTTSTTVIFGTPYIQWPYFTVIRPEPVVEVQDERHDAKAWARWFREFLEERLVGTVTLVLRVAYLGKVCAMPVCRSALRSCEWKLKSWKQSYVAGDL